MNPGQPQTPQRGGWLAGSLMGIGSLAFGLSFLDVASGFATRHDPGPWMLPRILALALIAGGGVLMLLDRRQVPQAIDTAPALPPPGRRLFELLGITAAYIAALPWAGFPLATALCSGLLLWRMHIAWWRAALAALTLTLVAYGLFAWLFQVPLPAGPGG